LAEDTAKLAAMGDGGGWPDHKTKAETGILRSILKEADVYAPALDVVPEFLLFRALCGDRTPRQAVEERIALAEKEIKAYSWVEEEGWDDHQCRLSWHRIPGYKPPTESYYMESR
jgi:hypothetical protein